MALPNPPLRLLGSPLAFHDDPAPVVDLAHTQLATDAITFSWQAGSALTHSFNVYGRRSSNGRRDLVDGNWTLVQNSSDTSYTATDLSAGTSYDFSVHALDINGNDLNQVQYTFQTLATAGQGQLPPGCTWL